MTKGEGRDGRGGKAALDVPTQYTFPDKTLQLTINTSINYAAL